MIDNIEEKYSVGALLYTPALSIKIAEDVIAEKFSKPYSLALCLEDTISDDSVEVAEKQLTDTLKKIMEERKEKEFYLPKIFIRVRSCEQLNQLCGELKPCVDVISGFIFPKYSVDNADAYNEAVRRINESSEKTLYMMPILESRDLINYSTRHKVLEEVKTKIDSVKEYVLNIRVGGNDFSNEFAARRHYDETIYDILPIGQLLGDILTVFSREYVVSGPVWEFFSSDNEEWKRGLMNELKLDRLNGFIGKTVIHPKQIGVVNEALKVSQKDYEDAKEILNWNERGLLVGKSYNGERMNEVKTHGNWAIKTVMLSKIYGIS
ncbi:HpcH/HpaI aldolase/citrate lyase family protein [Butyrivibrio sp. VCB2001]|uniref:HpcH/HpaI aldolase/citrate lyase family protein n=1 Tax=Butyrivibrio sp. VCB2001 TaxID=1280667 RepID=UPI00040CED81|nr:HpcH/HpaI aldolase/citrate lyase family protein [Butyrivibrio sp. VCB2001]